jgi:hypothetical protein
MCTRGECKHILVPDEDVAIRDKIIGLFAEQRASQRKLRSRQLERKGMQLDHKVVMLLIPTFQLRVPVPY